LAAIRIDKGEVRQLAIEVTSLDNSTFVIDTADYKVYNYEDKEKNTPIDEGTCTIIENKIIALFSATTRGTFVVEITYRIHPEILIATIPVTVI
jgi:hypothetical protein